MNINYEFETISAIATPMGMGGVGVIRVSGSQAFEIVSKMFSKKNAEGTFEAGKIHHGWITEENIKIDEVILLPFKNPNSYTGEDVVEIQCHGGVKVVKKILDLTIKNGARMAERGEFTKRAFLNHKLDLSQAEAVLDLIHAKTENFAKKSANNLSGALAVEINNIKNGIFELLSKMIAAIDFPEDVEEPQYSFLEEQTTIYIEKIEKVLKNANASNIMRQGIKIAIAGCPNAGKSSLFNALLSLERAIVTEIPGTTRDTLYETVDIGGIPATIIDTAGIREGEDVGKVEAIGIDFTKKCVAQADIILFLYDSSVGFCENDAEIFELIKEKPYIKIASKWDMCDSVANPDGLCISSKTGENIEVLREKIYELAVDKNAMETEFTTNRRQEECLKNALSSLKIAQNALKAGELQDLVSIDMKSALLSLDEITGEVITDDILNNIFDNFCIGK